MNALQDPSVLANFPQAATGSPFLGASAPSGGYLFWVLAWLLIVGAMTAVSFSRRDV